MKCSILVVDDDAKIRQMLRLLLELEGYHVSEAFDGLDALEQVAGHVPDAMVLDVMMPRMDGITLCRKLRAQRRTADLPIIILSGKTEQSAVSEGLAAGANKYMAKPMSTPELLANIREAIAGQKTPSQV